MNLELDPAELLRLSESGRLPQLFGAARDAPTLVVRLDATHERRGIGVAGLRSSAARLELGMLACVLIGVGTHDHPLRDLVDVVVDDAEQAAILVSFVEEHPTASVSLALVLRHGDRRTVDAGLVAESATYSMLQAGAEHARWRAARARSPRAAFGGEPPLLVDTGGDEIRIMLNRPAVHNALDREMTELLANALVDALGEPGRPIVIEGAGRSFCSGGDLDEFGAAPDAAAAHLVRVSRSVGRLVAALAHRITVRLHGACYGAGIELPAFAGSVVAAADARIALPEIALGLVPGAGGTVSIPRRIGRHRTMQLALSADPIDVRTAVGWGLVDGIKAADG